MNNFRDCLHQFFNGCREHFENAFPLCIYFFTQIYYHSKTVAYICVKLQVRCTWICTESHASDEDATGDELGVQNPDLCTPL
jgi:hypothetical protein